MHSIPDRHWQSVRDEFHVRLADLEALMQEEAYSYVDTLYAAGLTARANNAQGTADKLYAALTELQELANDVQSPQMRTASRCLDMPEVVLFPPGRQSATRAGGFMETGDRGSGRSAEPSYGEHGEPEQQPRAVKANRGHKQGDVGSLVQNNQRKAGLEGRMEHVRAEAVYHPPRVPHGGNNEPQVPVELETPLPPGILID